MKVKIRKIGNSQGIILPKIMIEKCSLKDEAELTLSGNQLIIQAPSTGRSTWEAAFEAALEEETNMLDEADLIQNEWDNEEWKW